MSLIHEALKKVERQRRLGEVPTLETPDFPPRRRRRWPWLAGALVLLLALGAAGWWWRAAAPAVTEVAEAPVAEAAAKLAVDAGNSPAAGPDKQLAAAAAAPGSATRPDRQAVATTAASPAAQAGDRESAPARADRAAATPAPDAEAPAGTALQDAGGPGETKPAEPATDQEAVPMFWELPYASRRNIPDMVISMHMYTDDPAERFVIVNGDRHVEGDQLTDAITLQSIDPDGLTLRMAATVFRMPRTGTR